MLKSIGRFSILLIIFISTFFLTCSKDSTGPKDEDPIGTKITASSGGTLTSSNGLLTLTIPPNALDEDTYINIEIVDEADYSDALDTLEVVGKVYDIQPDGTIFNTPAKLEFKLTNEELNLMTQNEGYYILTGLSVSPDGVLTEMDSASTTLDFNSNISKFCGYITHLSSQTKTIYIKMTDDTWPDGSVSVSVNLGQTDCPTDPQSLSITIENNTPWPIVADIRHERDLYEGQPLENDSSVEIVPFQINCSTTGTFDIEIKVKIFLSNSDGSAEKPVGELIFKEQYTCCDSDNDGVTDQIDDCEGYDDNADADGDGIPDGCDYEQPEWCNDALFDVAVRVFEFFFGASACNSSTDNVYTGPTQQTPTGGPTKNRSMDEVTTFVQGASRLIPDVYQRTTWDNSFPPDGQPNLPGDLVGSDDWQAWSLNPAGVQKQNRSSQSLDENPLIFINVMYANIPMNDPTYFYQFGFVFDRDGITTNNYQPSSQFENDFFKDTDYWIDIQYSPSTGWVMWVTDVANGAFEQVASEAQLIVINNTMFLVIPRSEFLAQNIGYRMTAYRHTGDWGLSGGVWDGDVQPPVSDGLKWLDIGQ